jgi:autotransporter-associated beta strand protein
LTAASLSHTPGNAVVLVNGLKLGQDSTSTGTGRFFLTAAPSLVGTTAATSTGINSAVKDTVIVPYLVGEAGTATGAVGTVSGTPNTYITYNAETGLRPMNLNDEFTQNAFTAGTNVRTNTDTLAATSVSINSLVVANATTNIRIALNQTLTIASGAILWTGGTTGGKINGASLNNGAKLDFGSQEAMLTVNSGINGGIAVIITGSGGLTKSGGGTLTLSGANTCSGDTTVTAGTLSLTTANPNNDGSKVTIASGAFLNLDDALSETVGFLYIDGVLQADGTYVAEGTQTGLEIGTPRITGGGKLVVSSTPPANDFTAWIADFSVGGLTGANDDFDNDGLANAVENVLGSNPSLTNTGLTGISASGSTFKFRHDQSNEIASDVAKSYQWSTDLLEWNTSGGSNAGGTTATIAEATITDNAAPANDVIEVTVTVTAGPAAKVFGRLVATKAP